MYIRRTMLNLGRHFDVPRERWAALAQRIEELTSRQNTLSVGDLSSEEVGWSNGNGHLS